MPEANSSDNYVKSDKWVRDASYCRLKNLVIGYTLPSAVASKLKIASLRLYVSGQNLFTISDFFIVVMTLKPLIVELREVNSILLCKLLHLA